MTPIQAQAQRFISYTFKTSDYSFKGVQGFEVVATDSGIAVEYPSHISNHKLVMHRETLALDNKTTGWNALLWIEGQYDDARECEKEMNEESFNFVENEY